MDFNMEAAANPSKTVKRFRCSFSGTICDAMKRRGWEQASGEDHNWDIFFCDMPQFRDIFAGTLTRPLFDHQKVGHFRNCQEISRKNLLVKNLKKFKQKLDKSFGRKVSSKCEFMPETFILPSEHNKFLHDFRINPTALWIIKPAAGAQGRGIFIFKSLQDYLTWRTTFDYDTPAPVIPDDTLASTSLDSNTDPDDTPQQQQPQQDTQLPAKIDARGDTYVVQKYITNPYLIGGRKFDIRFYVLVTSFQPLQFYMYREGFARFSAGQFSLDALQDVYIHLTNVAIQRTSEDYNPDMGSKWSLQSLREYLTARHGRERVQNLFNGIDMIVIRTLQSVVGLVNSDPHCFEVYGFDVLIDRDLKPWLLEVNASPAFTPSNEEDYILKLGLIDDTVSVLDLEKRLTSMEKRIGGYDLIYSDGPVYSNLSDCCHASGWENGPKLNSFLGCKNDRVPQLRDIYRTASFLKTTQALFSTDSVYKADQVIEDDYSIKLPKFKRSKDDRFQMPD